MDKVQKHNSFNDTNVSALIPHPFVAGQFKNGTGEIPR
jgi:hypothetical protein